MRQGGGVSIVVTAPVWFAAVLAEVDETFIETGRHTPAWPAPRPFGQPPTAAEYRRCTPPGKYAILDARLTAWQQVLTTRGIVTTHTVDPQQWPTPDTALESVHQLTPTAPRALSLLVGYRTTDGSRLNINLAVTSPHLGAVVFAKLPDCGCDACDNGSADLLTELDDTIRTVASGGVIHALGPSGFITRDATGCVGSGDHDEAWLDPDQPAPPDVRRWAGRPWEPSGGS